MSLSDRTERGQTETIAFRVDLPHAPEKVWRALTEPDLLREWLLPAIGFDLEPGTAFELHADPKPGWDGIVRCRLLEVVPKTTLTWAWVVGELDTVVRFTLAPTDGGTRLDIVQSGFRPDQKRNFGGARYGWRMMGERLEALLPEIE